MGKPNAEKALGPVYFRFTDPDDAGKYGAGWFCYEEEKVLRKRGHQLIELETDLGMPMVSVMNGFRESTTLGDMAAAWLGVRERDISLAGDFDSFDPIVMAIEWTSEKPEPDPKDEGSDTTPPPQASPDRTLVVLESTTSGLADTVALLSLPTVE